MLRVRTKKRSDHYVASRQDDDTEGIRSYGRRSIMGGPACLDFGVSTRRFEGY
jgi:hypothetical protein